MPRFGLRPYSPKSWYWVVGSDTSRAWSSAEGAYVSDYPADSVTRIASEEDLNGVLRQFGFKVAAPAQEDYAAAIQVHVDALAQAKGYADGRGLVTYATSSVAQWAGEAQAFIAWRDAVWLYAYAEMNKVNTGQRPKPTVAEIVSELPALVWPV